MDSAQCLDTQIVREAKKALFQLQLSPFLLDNDLTIVIHISATPNLHYCNVLHLEWTKKSTKKLNMGDHAAACHRILVAYPVPNPVPCIGLHLSTYLPMSISKAYILAIKGWSPDLNDKLFLSHTHNGSSLQLGHFSQSPWYVSLGLRDVGGRRLLSLQLWDRLLPEVGGVCFTTFKARCKTHLLMQPF